MKVLSLKKLISHLLIVSKDFFDIVDTDYYVYGFLRRPDDIPLDIFVNELCFYQLEKEAIEDFLADEGILLEDEKKIVEKKVHFKSTLEYIQFRTWECLEDPQSSRFALGISITSLIITVSSILILCVDSLPGPIFILLK